MSMGIVCKDHDRSHWVVEQREGNASAFNGYHWTRSDYSMVRCLSCQKSWRTKAAYVRALPDKTLARSKELMTMVKPAQTNWSERPYSPICIVNKELHRPRPLDPERCRDCGLFILE